jgi:hypothetical protein
LAALLICTQTKVKFYEKLLEGGARRWNALVGPDEVLRLEVETRLFRQRGKRRGAGGSAEGGDGSVGGGSAAGVVGPLNPKP